MSEVLTVPTSFEDISELAQGFADRVEENQIILYGATEYAEGDEITFQVALADGSVGLEGSGIVTASYDGGEDRDPEVRYDVVIAGLRFEGMSEVVFERLLVTRGSMIGDEPPSTQMPAIDESTTGGFDDEATSVASLDDLAALEAAPPVEEAVEAAAPAFEEPAAAVEETEDFDSFEDVGSSEAIEAIEEAPAAFAPPVHAPAAPTVVSEPPRAAVREVVSAVEVAPIAGGGRNAGASAEGFRGLPPPNAPPVPAGFTVQKALIADQLGRPILGSTWQPEARPREAQRASDGLFDYGGPIRLPAKPPRPEGLVNGHVARAPAPTTEVAYRAAREALGFTLQATASALPDDEGAEIVDDLDVVGN